MKYYGDYHTHTYYSDGVSSVEENIISAIEKGLKEIAFTDHGYNSPNYGALSRKDFLKQGEEIERYRKKYGRELKIYQGIEADIIGLDGTIDLEERELKQMEIVLVGYHSFARAKSFYDWRKIFINSFLSVIKNPSEETIKRNTATIINAIKRYPIDIICHINHLFKVDCKEVAKACADYGTYIELNAKHLNLTDEMFDSMLKTKADFIVNSDAHHYSKIGEFEVIEKLIEKHNLNRERIVNLGKKPEFPRKKIRLEEE